MSRARGWLWRVKTELSHINTLVNWDTLFLVMWIGIMVGTILSGGRP